MNTNATLKGLRLLSSVQMEELIEYLFQFICHSQPKGIVLRTSNAINWINVNTYINFTNPCFVNR